jgi:stage III sporulation protein AG
MKQKLKLPSADKILEFVKRYKYILIIIIAGIAILAVPTKKTNRTSEKQANQGTEEEFCLEEFEQELSDILSRIYGAGEATVMLTMSSEAERIFATNRECFADEEGSELREEMVIISTGSGEETVLLKRNYPTFRGALVVCPGGDDPNVVLLLTKALSSLTGLSTNRITVCKSS